MAGILETTLRESIAKGTPVERASWRSKKWFDGEVRERREEMTKMKRWRKGRTREQGEEENEEWKKKRNSYFRLIRKKKKEMWDKWVEEAETNKAMWGVWRLTTKNRIAKTTTLEKEGKRAVTFAEKEEMLRATLFQHETADDEEWTRKRKGERVEMTIEQVRKAFKNMGGLKAPGKDEIVVKAIKERMEVIGERLREVYQLSLNKGRHPTQWKTAIAAIIPKPGKTDYTKPANYRPVSLLNTMGKGLEKIAAEIITEKAESDEAEGIHDDQWGGRRGRGAEECVETTIWWANERKREGKSVVLVMMDVAQAFPSVVKGRMANRLEKMGLPEGVVAWVKDFMEERRVKLRIDNEEGEEHRVETGVPQGSPVSPVLFNVSIAPLLRRLETKANEIGCEMISPTFVDDVTMAIAGKNKMEAMENAEKLIRESEEWGREFEIKFEDKKME